MPADVFIDPLTGDLPAHNRFVEGFDLALQRLRSRLGTFFGEWRLDTSVGLPYQEWAQDKQPDLPAIGAIMLTEIIGDDGSGISRVDNFNVEFEARSGVDARLIFTGDIIFEPGDETAVTFRAETLIVAGNSTPAMLFFGEIGPIAGAIT